MPRLREIRGRVLNANTGHFERVKLWNDSHGRLCATGEWSGLWYWPPAPLRERREEQDAAEREKARLRPWAKGALEATESPGEGNGAA